MQEILAGARPRARVSPEAFEGGAWVYMVDVEAVEGGAVEGAALSKITVQVDRLKDETGRLPTEDEIDGFSARPLDARSRISGGDVGREIVVRRSKPATSNR